MDRIARASTDERRLVFEAAAQRMALAPAVVEKDFWVCYTLDHLFHRSGFAESMVFKGGVESGLLLARGRALAHIAFSVSKLLNNSSFETEKERMMAWVDRNAYMERL